MRKLPLLLLFLCACASNNTIRPAPELPKTTPWNLAELSKPPASEWVDSTGPVRSLLYAGEIYAGKPTRVFAYYATPGTLAGDPSKDRNLPAVVLVHGGGGTAFREWAEMWAKRGYAAIAMDLQGNRPNEGQNPHDGKNRTRLPDGGPVQSHENIFETIDQPLTEHWPYHAVANVIRAHSLVRSFSEVDADRTAVTGISWGGYLTCITASLDNRFKAAVPVYGCGFLNENSAWLGEFEKLGPERAKKWVEFYDPSRYLPACRVPIFFVNGTNDFAYPLDSYMKSFHAVKHAEKNIRVTVNMPHSHPAGWEPKEIGMFIDWYLLNGHGLPNVDFTDERTIEIWNRPSELRAMIHQTQDAGLINKCNWTSSELPLKEISAGMIEWTKANDPNQRIVGGAQFASFRFDTALSSSRAWFITITDDRGATVSSPVKFKD